MATGVIPLGELDRRALADARLDILHVTADAPLGRAATVERFLGGHLVQGHVDATAPVVSFDAAAASPVLIIEVPESVHALCVEKGSIAIDGVSLTVARKATGNRIEVAIVPHTIANTTMASYSAGRRVNVEADVIAKYVREFVRQEKA